MGNKGNNDALNQLCVLKHVSDMGHVGRCLEMIERRLQNRTIKNEHNNQRTEIRLRRVVVQDQEATWKSLWIPPA